MRIVIAGAGKLGFSIAQLLAEDQFDVVVVELDPKRKDVIQNTLDVLAIEGNSCSPTTFADPDISASDVLIACTDSDEVNTLHKNKRKGGQMRIGAFKQHGKFNNAIFRQPASLHSGAR